MAKIFNFPISIKDRKLIEQSFSLYQLIHGVPDHPDERTRRGDCYVTGINIVTNGTPEFDELIEKQRKKFEKMDYFTDDEKELMIQNLKSKDEVPVITKFAAMAHPRYWDDTFGFQGLDGCPYDAFITDFSKLAIIHPEEKRIAIVPYEGEGHHRKLFYDIGRAKMAGVRWQYDGTMIDALNEFATSYTFDIGKNPGSSKEFVETMKDHPRDYSRNYIITEKKVPLERIL